MASPSTQKVVRTQLSQGVEGDVHRSNPVPVYFGNTPSLDGFERLRVSNPTGIYDFKATSDRGVTQWYERLTGAIIVHGTVTGGPFQVGETITGGTSGKTGTITAVGADNVTYDTEDNDFTDGETITGGTSGATATVTTHDTGAHIEYNYLTSSISLKVGTVSGQKVYRQTSRPFPYVPMYSHLINTTQVFDTGKTGCKQTVIYGNSNDGLGLVLNGTELNVLLRTSTSGTAVDNLTPQSEWELDKLDGTGPSGITLDITKAQINGIDFQWLGVGRVRFFLNIDGLTIPIHEIDNANNIDKVYMRSPTLPIRYEIENTGTTASPTSLEQICCGVSSEGGFAIPGLEFSKGNTFAGERTVTTAWTPIFAIRMKNEYPVGRPNCKTARYLSSHYAARTNDASFKIEHIHPPTTSTATWTSVSDVSGVEYSTDITAVTGRFTHEIDGSDIYAGLASSGQATSLTSEFISNHSYIHQNPESDDSEMFVIFARSRTSTANVTGRITFVEFE